MFKTTLAGLLAHKLRLVLTSLAITLGVGFIAATFALTDTMQSGSVVMPIIGALTGVALGMAYGWAATRALDSNIIFAIPYLQILGLILIAALAGMIAGVLPARRAAGASIVGSLA